MQGAGKLSFNSQNAQTNNIQATVSISGRVITVSVTNLSTGKNEIPYGREFAVTCRYTYGWGNGGTERVIIFVPGGSGSASASLSRSDMYESSVVFDENKSATITFTQTMSATNVLTFNGRIGFLNENNETRYLHIDSEGNITARTS